MAERIDWPQWVASASMAAAAVVLGLLAGFDPRIAILAALAGAFVLIALNDLAMGIAFFILLNFLGFAPYGLEDALVRIVLVLSWFALLVTRRRSELEFPAVHPIGATLLLLFFGWVCISLAWADSPSEVFQAIERFGLSGLLILIVFTAIQTERDLGRVMVAFVVGAMGAAAYGLIAGIPSTDDGRLGTALLDPNILAATLVAATALSVAAFAVYRSGLARVGMFAALAFLMLGLWLTASRGGLIALLLALIAAIVFAGRLRGLVFGVAFVIVTASVIYFAGFAPQEARDRITGPAQGEERLQEGRTSLWEVGWRMAEANPVKGVGARNFRVASRRYLLEPGAVPRGDQIIDNPQVAHNAYLEILAELGLVGLSLFLSVAGFCVVSSVGAASLYSREGNEPMAAAAVGVAVAQIGMLAANFFISDEYSSLLWILLGLGPAVLALARAASLSTSRA